MGNLPALSDSGSSHKGLKLIQATESSGMYDVWISTDATRIFSRSNDFYIASQAPSWMVEVWRPDRKEFSQIPFEAFIKSDLLSCNRISYLADLRKPTQTEKQIKSGYKVLVYSFPALETVSGCGLFVADRTDGSGLKAGEKLMPKLISLDNNYPNQITQIIGKIYNLPNVKGFPISSYAKLVNGREISLLNGKILNPNFEFSSEALHAPAGYRKKSLDRKMFYTSAQSDILDQMSSF